MDLSIRRIKWNENSFELRFMGLETLTAIATTTTGGSTELHAALPVFVSDITSIDATYQSELYGVEANWQFVTYCPFQYILGVRYIGLDEDLTANLQSPTAPSPIGPPLKTTYTVFRLVSPAYPTCRYLIVSG